MRIPEPEDLDLSVTSDEMQSRYDEMMKGLQGDPDTYEDPDRADAELEVETPPDLTDGSVWAPQTMITQTTKPERPRTRTAGYDRKNFILTVQFRDGTMWNYYDVNPATWDAFRSANSKHEFIETEFAGWPNMGPVSGMTARQEAAYKGLSSIAKKTQNKTFVGGVSKGTPFGGKL